MRLAYFLDLYDGVLQNDQYDQVLFYELGRNFWLYGSQLSPIDAFVTGFAIANRFISMDRVPVNGGPYNGTLPYAQFENSVVSGLLSAYLADAQYNWQNTLAAGQPYPNANGWTAADLAGAMYYRIYSDNGFQAYIQFWRALAQRPAANTADDAIRNFLAAALTATGHDYGFLFKGQYAAPLPTITRGGDFDGNGVPDLVWMNSSTRQVSVNYYGGVRRGNVSGLELAESGWCSRLARGGRREL